jgi:hypothetical protein
MSRSFVQRIIHMDGQTSGGLGSNALQMVSTATGFSAADLVGKKRKTATGKKYEDLPAKALEALLKERGLKLTGTLEEKAARMRRFDYVAAEKQTAEGIVRNALGPGSDSDDPPIVRTYAEHFNTVDRFNRYYYQIEDGFRKRKPQSQDAREAFCPFPQTALGILAVNAWTARCERLGDTGTELKTFIKQCVRERMAKKNE